MTSATRVRVAAIVLFLAVALGALGAHGLKPQLESTGHVATWKTAILYWLIHGLAMFQIARSGRATGYYWFLAGVVLFSGSLVGLALTQLKILGPLTPIGGVCFLVGWACWIFTKSPED